MNTTTKTIRDIITQSPPDAAYSTGVSREEYVSIIGMNPSSLAAGLVGHDDVNPAAIKLAWEQPGETARTAAAQDRLDRGTLAHLMVLQPELVAERVAIWRGGRRLSNEWTKFEDENSGKLIITAADFAAVAKATKDLKLQLKVADLLRGIECEVALVGSEVCERMDGHIIVKGQVDGVNLAGERENRCRVGHEGSRSSGEGTALACRGVGADVKAPSQLPASRPGNFCHTVGNIVRND